MFVIKTTPRDTKKDPASLRKKGVIPAVFYGAGKKSTSISIPSIEFKKVWREAGESSTIKISTGSDDIDVLIHEVQVDPVTSAPIHVDFLVIDMNKKVQVAVGLVFEGISNAVKTGIGTLVKVLHEIEIEALPKDLPQKLIVDISKLETPDDVILLSDIKLPSGVVTIADDTKVVASIVEQVEEKEEIVEEPVDLSDIEVEKRGKKEEGEEEDEAKEETKEGGKEDKKEAPAPAKEEEKEKK